MGTGRVGWTWVGSSFEPHLAKPVVDRVRIRCPACRSPVSVTDAKVLAAGEVERVVSHIANGWVASRLAAWGASIPNERERAPPEALALRRRSNTQDVRLTQESRDGR
jgi:hypothetical protein